MLIEPVGEADQFLGVTSFLADPRHGLTPKPCPGAAVKESHNMAEDMMHAGAVIHHAGRIGGISFRDRSPAGAATVNPIKDTVDVRQHVGHVVGRAPEHDAVEEGALCIDHRVHGHRQCFQAAIQNKPQVGE